MRTQLSNLDDCAVPFLRRAAVNLRWYYYSLIRNRIRHKLYVSLLLFSQCTTKHSNCLRETIVATKINARKYCPRTL